MSNQIQPQVDVGTLGLKGLGLFSNVLAALSADNVTPMAMLQMEQLGAAFHVNGRYADSVPELLTQSSSHPIGRLTLAAGWRRGDSISLLTESAGGQAASLLSLCITNIYNKDAVGEIISRLSSNLLPKSFPSAGITHLADVATLVASKLNRLGFGNVLAEQAMRAESVYEKLNTNVPDGLLDLPTIESMVGAFECLSHVTEVGTTVRISGSCGILYLLAIIIFMFPLDAIANVDSYIIHEGNPGGRIIIDICDSAPVQMQVEKDISASPIRTLLIKVCEDSDKIMGACSFTWEGWLARKLQLEFARFGSTCNQQVLIACCTIIRHLTPNFKATFYSSNETKLPHNGLEGLLGLYSEDRISRICQQVFLEIPEQTESNAETAWERFAWTLKPYLERVKCRCSKCNPSQGWKTKRLGKAQQSCPRYQLWEVVGKCLTAGLYCLLINTHGSVSVPGRISLTNRVADVVGHIISGDGVYLLYPEQIIYGVMGLVDYNGSLGRSSGACTIFPTALETLEVDPDQSFTFELYDGVFVFEDRYHHELSSDSASRPKARKSLSMSRSQIVPSNHGEHSSIQITVREGYKKLLLQVTIHALGSFSRLDLASIMIGCMGLGRAQQCEHPLDSPLTEAHHGKVIVTGVNSPGPHGANCLLVQETCLNCAVEQAAETNILIIS